MLTKQMPLFQHWFSTVLCSSPLYHNLYTILQHLICPPFLPFFSSPALLVRFLLPTAVSQILPTRPICAHGLGLADWCHHQGHLEVTRQLLRIRYELQLWQRPSSNVDFLHPHTCMHVEFSDILISFRSPFQCEHFQQKQGV